jgi:hypothetical protein
MIGSGLALFNVADSDTNEYLISLSHSAEEVWTH